MAKKGTVTKGVVAPENDTTKLNGLEAEVSVDMNNEEEGIPMNVKIRFVNKSNDINNSDVVIFAKNIATNFDETAVAWRVIKNCGRDWTNTFNYPLGFDAAAADSYGNVSDLQAAAPGQKWEVVRSNSGDIMQLSAEPATSPMEVEIKNSLSMGSINAQIYKDGRLFATKTGVSPGQKAVFEFHPTLWVGVLSQVEEGKIINSAILSDINTELSLFGLTSADLIMTGGGVGPNAMPFQFHLIPTA